MRRKTVAASIFMGKYVNKKKLGKGAFGDVFLVEDPSQQLFALKVIDKKKLEGDNEEMIEYLKGEVECMKKMNYKYLTKLHDFLKDDNYYYMVLQYCDGGDLVNEQALLPDMVFPLAKATEYLSQVIRGLEQLHNEGYLHRDIKLQNVLIKNENGQKVLKIADFGFAKKAVNLTGTVLGTEMYMSPEIYHCGIEEDDDEDEGYGYEVDMWAFGVVFFYMLNLDFPFQLNPYWSLEEKYKQLTKMAEKFSYKLAVNNTRKKIVENCTPDMEDLFKKIFTIDRVKRINFAEVRQHPVFAKHFPKPSPESVILYHNKFQSKRYKKGQNQSGFQNNLAKKNSLMSKKDTLGFSSIIDVPEEMEFPREKEILRMQIDEISFLNNMVDEINMVEDDVGQTKSLMFAFNVVKYYIILLNRYLAQLKPNGYDKKYKHLKLEWHSFFNTPELRNHQKDVALRIKKAQMEFQDLHKKCSYKLDDICKMNYYFRAPFESTVEVEDEDSLNFFQSYRKSTDLLYSTLKEYLRTNKKLVFYFYLCVVCICHIFNELYDDIELKKQLFSTYIEQETEKTEVFCYERFTHYLKTSSKETLLKLTKKLIEECMMK